MNNHKPRLVVKFFASITRVATKRFVSQVAPRIKDVSELILLINSTGGSVELAYALAQFIAKINGPVITYNIRMCASAAVMIFAAGHERVAQKSSIFHVHEVATKGTSTAAQQSRNINAWNQKIAKCLHSQTGHDVASWRRDMICNRQFNSSDAIEIGLATRIGCFHHRRSDVVIAITD